MSWPKLLTLCAALFAMQAAGIAALGFLWLAPANAMRANQLQIAAAQFRLQIELMRHAGEPSRYRP